MLNAAPSKEIKPKWCLYRQNDTALFAESESGRELLSKCGGRIDEIFIYDSNSRTYLCEITPSYTLFHVGGRAASMPADDEVVEAIDEALIEAYLHSELVTYIHCHSIDSYPENTRIIWELTDEEWAEYLDEEDPYKAALEACEELVFCNGGVDYENW